MVVLPFPLPSHPPADAPSHDWMAFREVVCLAARHAESVSVSLVEHLADQFARQGKHSSFPARSEWEGLLAALRANPAWDEVDAVEYVAHMAVTSVAGGKAGLPQVDQWPGLGRLLVDTPAFADQVRVDADLHSVLWRRATQALDALSDTDEPGFDEPGLAGWPRFAVHVLAQAGTETPKTIRRWRRQLTRRAEPIADAVRQYALEERKRMVIPPEASLAAMLLCQEAPPDFAEAVRDTLGRQPLVAVLSITNATIEQCAAVDPEVIAQVLALPGLSSQWRVGLLTAAGRRVPVSVPQRTR